MDQNEITHRLERAAWPIAAEQVEPLRLLLDPATHGGAIASYMETALSHIIYVEDRSYILRRPLRFGENSLLTPEDRWHWCEDQAGRERHFERRNDIRILPLVRRNNTLYLGGPGEVMDWVLERSRSARPKLRTTPSPGSPFLGNRSAAGSGVNFVLLP